MEDIIDIIVTETTNLITITSSGSDEVIDVNIIDNREDIVLNVTPSVVEININSLVGNFGVNWGQIGGTLTSQTDLNTALGLKADLVGGKVPSSQLPSYVDDVVEVANYAALPATGETGKIYVTIDTNYIYRWTGSVYVEIKDSSAVWGAITGTLSNQTDLQNALNAKFDDPTGDATQYIDGTGALQTFPVLASADKLILVVRNTSGATITKGTVVYINGANGNKPTIAKALATGDATSAQTLGLVQTNIANNSNGNVVLVGSVIDLDTSAFTEGQQLYLSGVTAGAYTATKTLAPTHLVYVGVIARAHPTLGVIEVKIQNGYELYELHDVSITSVADNQGLFYESSTDLWKNKSIATVLGYTPEQPLTFSSPLIRTTNAISIQVASASQNGYLSSTDWITFNGKQAALSGTGFVKISGTTISYDNSTYLTTSAAASTYLALAGGTLTGAVTGTRLSLSQNSADITLSISNAGTGRAFSVLGTSYFSSDISFGSLSNGILKANALGALVLAIAGTDYQAPLSGTGFVKSTAGTISYDTSTYALDSAVVHLTGAETITGLKYFFAGSKHDLLFVSETVGYASQAGYSHFKANTNHVEFINSTNTKATKFIHGNAAYEFTMPNASGTIALTSNLASYLPLAGGTLTGALNGTSALFSGAVRANNPAEGATGEGLIAGQSFKIDGTGTSQKAVMYLVSNVLSDTYASGLTAQFANFAGDKAFGFNLNTSGGFELYVKNTSFNKALTISNTNAVTLTGALSGTSAGFSSSVTASTTLIGRTSYTAGGSGGSPYYDEAIIIGQTGNQSKIQYGNSFNDNNGTWLRFVVNGIAAANTPIYPLVLAPTGAATFSSSVNAGSTSSGAQVNVYASSYGNNGLFNAYGTDGNIKLQMGGLGTNEAFIYTGSGNKLSIFTGGSPSMTILASGSVGIGTTSPNSILEIAATTPVFRIQASDSANFHGIEFRQGAGFDAFIKQLPSTGEFRISNGRSVGWGGHMTFYTDTAERMRITSGGDLALGDTSAFGYKVRFKNAASSPYGISMVYTASPNVTGDNQFLIFADGTNDKFVVWSSGTAQNRTGVYGTISDISLKENIINASPKLEDLSKLKVRNFNFIGEDLKQIGFVAQEIEEIFPNMVDIDTKGIKSVKTTVLIPMLVKAVQELKAELDTLKNK